MTFNEELKSLVEQLEKLNLDRRSIEKELGLSPKYLDQQISSGGNEKLNRLLKMHLRIKELENQVDKKNSLIQVNQATDNFDEILNRIDRNVQDVAAITVDAREHTLLTESLSRALLYHSAHMEQVQFGGDFDKISEALHKVTLSAYKQLRQTTSANEKNEKVA